MKRIVFILLVLIAPNYLIGQYLDNNNGKKKALTPSLKDRVYECEGREWGFGIGTSHVKSDIGVQNSPFDGSTNVSAHVFFRKRYNPVISLSTVLAYGKISGDDKNDANFEIKDRGKNFTNNIVELYFSLIKLFGNLIDFPSLLKTVISLLLNLNLKKLIIYYLIKILLKCQSKYSLEGKNLSGKFILEF